MALLSEATLTPYILSVSEGCAGNVGLYLLVPVIDFVDETALSSRQQGEDGYIRQHLRCNRLADRLQGKL